MGKKKPPALAALMRQARLRRRERQEAAKPPRPTNPRELRRVLAQRARQRARAQARARDRYDAEVQSSEADLEHRIALSQTRNALQLQQRVAHAQALVAAVQTERGTPQVRLWVQGHDVRIYFPRPVGYVTPDVQGRLYGVVRGQRVFAEQAMYPGWRRAWRRALASYHEGLEARLMQFQEQWDELDEEDVG